MYEEGETEFHRLNNLLGDREALFPSAPSLGATRKVIPFPPCVVTLIKLLTTLALVEGLVTQLQS